MSRKPERKETPMPLQKSMSEAEIDERSARISKAGASEREDVSDLESGQRGIDEKGDGKGPPLSDE